MPTIPTLSDTRKKYKKPTPYISYKKEYRTTLYALPQWRRLRKAYLLKHPLDELLQIESKIILAEHVHHIISPFDFTDIEVAKVFLLDEDNLCSLSSSTHGLVHGNYNSLTPKLKEYLLYKILRMKLKLIRQDLNLI